LLREGLRRGVSLVAPRSVPGLSQGCPRWRWAAARGHDRSHGPQYR
jgi:hypothetical protein